MTERVVTMGTSADQFIDGDPQGPHIFIQWKGTDVCADIYCECGAHGHVDAEFMYAVRCEKCDALYEVGCYVAMRKVDKWDGCEPKIAYVTETP